MIDARHAAPLAKGGGDGEKRVRNVRRRRWPAALVVHDAQHLTLCPHPQHGLDEVLAMRGKDPGRAQDHRLPARLGHPPFAQKLRCAIGTQGCDRIILAPGPGARAVEDIVGGDMQERQPPRRRRTGHRAGRLAIHQIGRCPVGFGLIDGGVGGGVDNEVRIGRGHNGGAGGGVAQVGHIAPDRLNRDPLGRPARKLPRKLPCRSEDHNSHERSFPP